MGDIMGDIVGDIVGDNWGSNAKEAYLKGKGALRILYVTLLPIPINPSLTV